MSIRWIQEFGWNLVGKAEEENSLRSSLTTAARASGFRPRSQSAISTERVWRSNPVSSKVDMWNTRSRDSRAVFAAPESICLLMQANSPALNPLVWVSNFCYLHLKVFKSKKHSNYETIQTVLSFWQSKKINQALNVSECLHAHLYTCKIQETGITYPASHETDSCRISLLQTSNESNMNMLKKEHTRLHNPFHYLDKKENKMHNILTISRFYKNLK